MRKWLAWTLAATFMAGTSASAHHSFTATYDENKVVTIEGGLVQFLFRNPHAFVHVMAADENGVMQRWGVEWGGAGQLSGQGVTRESLKPGDHASLRATRGATPPITAFACARCSGLPMDSAGAKG